MYAFAKTLKNWCPFHMSTKKVMLNFIKSLKITINYVNFLCLCLRLCEWNCFLLTRPNFTWVWCVYINLWGKLVDVPIFPKSPWETVSTIRVELERSWQLVLEGFLEPHIQFTYTYSQQQKHHLLFIYSPNHSACSMKAQLIVLTWMLFNR